MKSTEEILQDYYASFPEWAREAYHKDVLVNQVTKQSALQRVEVEQLPWIIAEEAFKRMKLMEDAMLEKLMHAPSPTFVIPRA